MRPLKSSQKYSCLPDVTMKTFLFVAVGIFLLSAPTQVCAQTYWTKHPNNPVLDLGTSGDWDDERVADPSVLLDGTTHHMWYVGYDGTTFRIGYATSPDGVTWTKDTNNPVLNLGPPGSWDDLYVYTPSVVFDGSTFHMWYAGYDGTVYRIGYATSPDGVNWTRYDDGSTTTAPYAASDPVLDLGPAGSWDDVAVTNPFVLSDGATYHMWYLGGDGVIGGIGYATSPDGVTWTKDTHKTVLYLGPAGSWDDVQVFLLSVVFDGSIFHMWYTGNDGTNLRIGYAYSSLEGISLNATLIGVFDTGGYADGVAVSGSYVYVADGDAGLRIIDVSTPSSPQEMGFFDTGGDVQDVAVSGSYVYVAGGSDGLFIIQNDLLLSTKDEGLSLPKSFVLHQNYPNPFNPVSTIQYELPQASHVSLIVYDVLGREVARLVDGYMEPGYHQIQWNGRNRDGREVPTGIYIARLVTPEYSRSIKMVLLK